jgi:hypothetical protein
MNIIDAIIKSNSKKEIFRIFEHHYTRPVKRYADESLFICFLAEYALNKDKNINKPNFEGLELIDIFTHLVSEIFEIKYELNQEKIDFNRLLNEIADCAGLLAGLVAYIIEHKGSDSKERFIQKEF